MTNIFLVFCAFLQLAHGLRLNITTVDNCQDEKLNYDVVPVELLTVTYDRSPVDGVCDTFHATYIVRTLELLDDELIITSYSCSLDSPMPCLSNPVQTVEPLDCNRFQTDSSGPWYMFSQSMTGKKCGGVTGEFALDSAMMKSDYLKNYFNIGVGRYRIKMLFHKAKADMDKINLRGCAEIDFDIID